MAHEQSSTAMDYAEHEKSYSIFVKLTAMGTVAVLNIVLVLLIVGFYSAGWGLAFLALTLLAVALGFLANHTWVPSGVVFALASVFSILTMAG
jgi:hypothetical protein